MQLAQIRGKRPQDSGKHHGNYKIYENIGKIPG
jgi:hypothetical protein